MDSEYFRPLMNCAGPFASVYFDASFNTADTPTRVAAICTDVRKGLEDQGAEPAVIARLEEAILGSKPAVGRRGRGVIASADRVWLNDSLFNPPPVTVLRASRYPYLLPFVGSSLRRPPYLFAAVDHLGADIILSRGEVVRSETVDGGGYPVHKPASAGVNGYGDLQHTAEEAVRKNVRAVAMRLTELVDETGAEIVFVCGEVRSRTDVTSELPQRVAARVVQLHAGERGRRAVESEFREEVAEEFERRRDTETTELVDRFRSETGRGTGLAAEGLRAVCAALREGAVETLIVGDLADKTVVTGAELTTVATDADELSELGEAVSGVARADEALPFAALAIGAGLIRLGIGSNPIDGIAALLRYAPTGATQAEGHAHRALAR